MIVFANPCPCPLCGGRLLANEIGTPLTLEEASQANMLYKFIPTTKDGFETAVSNGHHKKGAAIMIGKNIYTLYPVFTWKKRIYSTGGRQALWVVAEGPYEHALLVKAGEVPDHGTELHRFPATVEGCEYDGQRGEYELVILTGNWGYSRLSEKAKDKFIWFHEMKDRGVL